LSSIIPNSGKIEKSGGRHAGKCLVCNHANKQEIEVAYLLFESVPKIAERFEVADDSIYRHAEFFGLDDQRAGDTKKVLQNVIARGFAQSKNIDPRVALGAVQELNKIEGKHKAPETHPADVERAEGQKREALREWFEQQGILTSDAVQ
jgi:hypothetical protein